MSHLLVADYRSRRTYSVRPRPSVSEERVQVLDHRTLAEHAGFLTLPVGAPGGTRWAYVDDRAGTLVCGGPRPHHIPVAIPAEHLACDPSGRYVAVSTGAGLNEEPWSDVLTVADLRSGESVRFRSRTGEPGVMITVDQHSGEPMLVLRHRCPGAVEVIDLRQAVECAAHVPQLSGTLFNGLGDDGHGDVVDQRTGICAVSTGRGLERFVVDNGRIRPLGIVGWPAQGRAYYLRLDPQQGRALGVLRGGPADPGDWPRWTNTLVEIELTTGAPTLAELPPGLAFRFALAGNRVAVAILHPDRDLAVLLERTPAGLTVVRSHILPALSAPPIPGRLPWDGVDGRPAQRRAIALDPSGETMAVTRGGDGELPLISSEQTETISFPTPIDEGGHLLWLPGQPPALPDSVGR